MDTSYDGDNCIRLGKKNGQVDATIFQMLEDWQNQKAKLLAREISKEEYDEWRYHYPASSSTAFHPTGNDDLTDAIAHAAADEQPE